VLRVLIAVLIGGAILALGVWMFRAIAFSRAPADEGEEGPEDVTELDVFFVCTECGTEFRVEKLGELQVPRHCGERMRVERRPRAAPDLN
jgi:DNA-directed RNA polymerase subunit RPC12/RpoP